MPPESGDLSGKYNPDYVPYLWGVFAALDDPDIRIVAVMKAAQIGWTFSEAGYLGKRIECLPGNIIILFPKDGAAREFADEKFTTSIRATPAMSKLIDITTTRKNGQRTLFKKFPGGFVKMVGSNSASNVKSTPAQLIIVEEVDDTSENVKDQGDALRLIRERLKRQRSGKLVLGGTPSIKGVSRIDEYIQLSNQMVLPIRCHDCGDTHVLDWDHVHWDQRTDNVEHVIFGKNDPDSATYVCPKCGSIWDDWQRKKNILNTVKSAYNAGEKYCGWEPTVECQGNAFGFKELNELYVCLPGTSLSDVVRDYLESEHEASKGDESGRIVFCNSKLARPYEYKSDAPEVEELIGRGEDYLEKTVPYGGLVLTAGVDVQHDRLAICIWAWGRDEEMWLVYWGELAAERTTIDKNDSVWMELDKFLFSTYPHASGIELKIKASSIDSSDGQTSDAVYSYVRSRQKKGIMAAKGSSNDSGQREIFMLPKKIDPVSKTKISKYGLQTYIVGTYKAKELLIGSRGRITLQGRGPGRIHWYKGVRSDFLDQLMSEVLVPHRRQRRRFEWRLKSGVRNEALDCTVLATHASRAVKVHIMTPSAWDTLEAKISQVDLFSMHSKHTPGAIPNIISDEMIRSSSMPTKIYIPD